MPSGGLYRAKQNPADCASRGLLTNQLLEHSLWWTGPSWLYQNSEKWPSRFFEASAKANQEERSRHILLTVEQKSKTEIWDLAYKYSSLKRLLRITAVCFRVAARFRKNPTSINSPLTPAELQHSCNFWIKKYNMYISFNELKTIKKGIMLPKLNPSIRLTPFIDKKEILRVEGPLQNSLLTFQKKHPIILPRSSQLTNLLIQYAHMQTFHGGTQTTLAYIRQKYWIIGGRTPVRSYILCYTRCTRFRGQ